MLWCRSLPYKCVSHIFNLFPFFDLIYIFCWLYFDFCIYSFVALLMNCSWRSLCYHWKDDIFSDLVQQINSETNWYAGNQILTFTDIFYWQYYYSVRIFPGQEPANVWVGWITSDFHQYDTSFDLDRVRTVTVTLGDEKGKVHERLVTIFLKRYIFYTHNSNWQLINC